MVGVRVLGGKLRSDVDLIKTDGKKVGHLETMQLRQETIREADAGLEVAISIEGATVGRQVSVGDDLFVDVPERHVKVLENEMLKTLNVSTQEVLREFTTHASGRPNPSGANNDLLHEDTRGFNSVPV